MGMIDAFVIGGGPAGLAAAIAARRRGRRVTVADALVPPIDKACGEGLMPDGLEALGRLGVALPAEESCPFRGIRLLNGDDRVAAPFPKGYGLGVRRTTLHGALVEQAEREGAHLLWGATVTGVSSGSVEVNGVTHRPRWIIGADGSASRVRKWIGLEPAQRPPARIAFRRHYQVAPWTEYMEIHWGDGRQIYVTPVSPAEVCVVLISRDSTLRLDSALLGFPQLAARLAGAKTITSERGAVTVSRRLPRVYRGNAALIGDASGSVDAITGEGLHLAFAQALALADALATNRLDAYDSLHRQIRRRSAFMARFMLTLGESSGLRRRAIGALSLRPDLFADLLALHVGAVNPLKFASMGTALAAGMLKV